MVTGLPLAILAAPADDIRMGHYTLDSIRGFIYCCDFELLQQSPVKLVLVISLSVGWRDATYPRPDTRHPRPDLCTQRAGNRCLDGASVVLYAKRSR